MDTFNKEELYPLPFFEKLKPSLKLQLFYFLIWLWATGTPILILFNYEKIKLIDFYNFSPETYIVVFFILSIIWVFYWIRSRNGCISITESCIEKKSRKGIKRIQWTEIQDVQLFDKTKIEVYGNSKEVNYGPSIGIILKNQSIWQKEKNDLGRYYMVISKAFFDEIDIEKLYLTIKSHSDNQKSENPSN